MSKLRVRVYNIRFGDAILVSVPERKPGGGGETTRHILIDVGNVLSGAGGDDAVFEPVIRDVLKVLDGRPLDLYVMTHEHLDHVQGLLYGSERLGLELKVQYAWLTGSAAEDYYGKHPDARKQKLTAETAYGEIRRFVEAAPEREPAMINAVLLNNDSASTSKCIAYLRKLAKHTAYVYRGCDLKGKHPFREARFSIWAPEEDTSDYYGKLQPMALGVTPGTGQAATPALTVPLPPGGVDAGAFYNLVELRRQGYADNLLAIDRAANNTSVVVCLKWRGWKLLFPGDAEQRSWKTMDKHDLLEPIHFLKIGHHGSGNGTPPVELLDKILPRVPPDQRRRRAVVSTCLNTYNNVPDKKTLAELRRRSEVQSTLDLPDGGFRDIEFQG